MSPRLSNRLLAAFMLVGVALLGCSNATATDPEVKGKPVRIAILARADIEEVLTYPADLEPQVEVRMVSPVPDRILDFPWKEGDEIKRGQRVALVRKEGMDRGLEGLSAQIESLDIQIANLGSDLQRSRGLLDGGAMASAAFDRAESAYKATLAQRKALVASRAQLAAQAGNAVITAPISGIIANKMLERGDLASPGVPLCRIIDIERLKVRLRLAEHDVAKVCKGQSVVVHLDAYPDKPFRGEIATVMPYIDRATRTNTVEVTLDNPKQPDGTRQLKPGMYGRAHIVVDKRDQVVVAPEPALLLDNALLAQAKPGEVLRRAVIVDAQSIARHRLVRLGARSGTSYEVLEGLAEGERIIIRGQHGLKDGQAVEIIEAANQN